MASNLPPIALFGYDSSPFTNKIRLTLRFMQIPYTFVIVPSMMPRPILVENFNLKYRKIPVLAVGKDLIVDTSLIAEWLYLDPRLKAYRDAQTGPGQEIHHDAQTRVLARLLSSHYTDRPLFRTTTGLIPAVVWRTRFGEDRAGLIGHKLDADKLEKKVPRNLAALDTHLSILEPIFEGVEGWMLGGEKPSAVDLALFYQLDWGERIGRGEGIGDLTGGGTRDGVGEGMKEVFNEQRYPGLTAWFRRFDKFVDAMPVLEKRVEKGDEAGIDEVMSALEAVKAEDNVRMLATPNTVLASLEARSGLRIGAQVSVAPDDTGRGNPTIGKLVGMSPEEVVIVPEPAKGNDGGSSKARIEDVNVHFPRVGFVVKPIREAKL